MTGRQSPAMRRLEYQDRVAEQESRPQIRPLGIFVARRQSFELVAPPDLKSVTILYWLFKNLPLREHGWSFHDTRIEMVDVDYFKRTWRVERE